MSIGSVSVDVVPSTENFWRSFRARTQGQAQAEGRRAGEEFRRGLDEANRRPLQIKAELDAARLRAQIAEATRGQSVRIGAHVDTAKARTELATLNREGSKSAGGLMKALLPLAPAVVPLAGAAAAAAAGLAGLGVAGLLAFGGLKNAMDEGTVAGRGLQTTFGGLRSDLAGLQSRAAAGILPGVEASVATIKRETATLGPVFKGEAALLGTALSSITTGLVGGFNSFAPVLNQVGVSIDHVAATFAAWATGPGGAKFANALSAEYAQVAPVLGDVAQALGRVIGAGNATGLSIVSLIDGVATVINHFPTGALTAIVDGFVLFKAATLASAAFTAAKTGIAALGVAYSNVAAISQASSVARIAADEAAASVAADAAARSAAAMVLEAQAARASLLEIAAARGSNTASQQAQLDVQLAVADRQIAAYQAVATAAAASAAEQGAAAEGMAAVTTRIGGAARSGVLGIVGGVAAAAIGIGLLVSQFHHSEDASRAAAVAAQAYTDALKGGGGADLVETITKGLTDANIGAKVREVNAAISDLGKGDFTATREFARALKGVKVNAADFAGAIQHGGKPLADLRAQLTNIAAVSDAAAAKFERLAIAGQGDQRTLQLKEQAYHKQAAAARALLNVLNVQVKAYHDGQKAELDYYAAIGKHVATVEQVAGSLHLATAQVKAYGEMAGIAFSKNGVADASFGRVRAAVAAVAAAFNTATATGSGFLSALSSFSTSAGTSADRAALIGATLKAANGDALAYAGAMNSAAAANSGLVSSLRQAASQVGKSGISVGTLVRGLVNLKTGTINYRKTAAGPLISGLQSIQSAAMAAAQATFQHARATHSGKEAADAAYKVYVGQTRGALIGEASQLGLTRGQAKKLADQYFGMPKKVKTLIEQEGANPVVNVLNKIGTQLSYLTGHPWGPKVDANTVAAHAKIRDLQAKVDDIRQGRIPALTFDAIGAFNTLSQLQGQIDALHGKTVVISTISADGTSINVGRGGGFRLATGGPVHGPGTGTSDSIPAWLSNGEYVVNAKATAKHRHLLDSINKGARGFAAGGPVGNAAQIANALRAAFGLTGNQIAGILGNLKVESGFNPRAYNARENAHGFAQWEGPRWTALQRFAAHMGVSASSTRAQVGFLVQELRGSGLVSQIRRMSDPGRVAALIDARFERSSGSTRQARIDAARQIAARGVAGASSSGVGATTRIQNLIGRIGQSASPPFDINQQGFRAISAQIRRAQVALLSWHVPLEKTRKYEEQIIRLSTILQHQLQNLRIKVNGADLAAVKKALGGTASDLHEAFRTLNTDLRNIGSSSLNLSRARKQEGQILAANRRYTAARDYTASIKDTLAGSFDPTHFGSTADLVAGLRGQTGQNNTYARELTKLRRESKGDKTLTAFINELAASGQTATLESLAGASKTDLANVSKSLGAYNQSVVTGANAATVSKYGATDTQLRTVLTKLDKRLDAWIAAEVKFTATLAESHRRSPEHTARQIEHALSELETLVRHGRA